MVKYCHRLRSIGDALSRDAAESGAAPSGGPAPPPPPYIEYKRLKKILKKLAPADAEPADAGALSPSDDGDEAGATEDDGAAGAASPTAGDSDSPTPTRRRRPATDVGDPGAAARAAFDSVLRDSAAAVGARFAADAAALLARESVPRSEEMVRAFFARLAGVGACQAPQASEAPVKTITRRAALAARGARRLRLYAEANAVAVRKITKKAAKHDSEVGRAALAELWARAGTATSFLRSPLLVDLWAVEALHGGKPPAPWGLAGAAALDAAALAAAEKELCEAEAAEAEAEAKEAEAADLEEERLSCGVCLETVHHAVGLACGHHLCAACARRMTNLPPAADWQEAPIDTRCPKCRAADVFSAARALPALDRLALDRRGKEEWKRREREEQQANAEAARASLVGARLFDPRPAVRWARPEHPAARAL